MRVEFVHDAIDRDSLKTALSNARSFEFGALIRTLGPITPLSPAANSHSPRRYRRRANIRSGRQGERSATVAWSGPRLLAIVRC
jgi:hypothetical protein